MTEFDLFDLTGLPFDPCEKAAKKVRAAIDKCKKDLSGDLSTATQQIERDEISRKIEFLNLKISVIFGQDGKLTPAYEQQAKAKTKQAMESLKAAALLLKQSGSYVITNGTIRKHRQKTKLTKEHVEEVFRSEGFTIKEVDPLKAYPKFPTNADKIDAELESLRRAKDLNPDGPDLSLVADLYTFAAYLAGEPKNGAEYRSKPTVELASFFDGYAKKFATRNDNLGKLCASLATEGKKYVFNSEANRQAYEAFLKYKTPDLLQLFKSMAQALKSDLLDPRFAEVCIKQISEVFGSYEVALAIYNKEAGLKDEPYIPEKSVFHIKCAHCQNVVEFADVADAKKVNKCSHCGKTLYKKCKKCKKSVLESADRCPECGFVFASAVIFDKYFSAANQAFHKSDFKLARDLLLKAESADPSEKSKVAGLLAQITAGEKIYKKPVNELRKLTADKMFQKASVVLANIIVKYPDLDIAIFEAQIDTALSQAWATFKDSAKLSSSKRADICFDILNDCVDFKPAITWLRATPPEPCKDVSVSLDTITGCVNVSWTRSLEQGITYCLVRKQGKDIPSNERDGKVLINNTADTSYQDKEISPGISYSYAVFTIRYGIYSSASGKTTVLLADVTDVHVEQVNQAIQLTWRTPENSTGVTIRRSQDGTGTVLTNDAHERFKDASVQYDVTYSYRLSANYANLPSSRGVDIVITPMVKINSFTIIAKQQENNVCNVSWSIERKGVDLCILVNDERVKKISSDASSCNISLLPNALYSITALAFSGGNWLRSENSPQINTCFSCSIDKGVSRFNEKDMISGVEPKHPFSLEMKVDTPIPSNVEGFYCCVRTEANQNRWPTLQDIGIPEVFTKDSHELSSSDRVGYISLAEYQQRKQGIVFYSTTRKTASLYVSLFTVYNINDRMAISNPTRCRFSRPLSADLFWDVRKELLQPLKLSVIINGNRPFTRIPALTLCACEGDKFLLSPSDIDAKQRFVVPEIDLPTPQVTYERSYDIMRGTDLSTKQLKRMKFFLFETTAISGEVFTLRWKQGFTGKVR